MQIIAMNSTASRIANEALALSEEDRLGVFLQLASSLPSEKSQWAESARRAEEMRSGRVVPMSENDFNEKLSVLKESFRKQA